MGNRGRWVGEQQQRWPAAASCLLPLQLLVLVLVLSAAGVAHAGQSVFQRATGPANVPKLLLLPLLLLLLLFAVVALACCCCLLAAAAVAAAPIARSTVTPR